MQPGDIFGGGRQNGCNCLLHLSTKHVCENFGGLQLPGFSLAWLRSWRNVHRCHVKWLFLHNEKKVSLNRKKVTYWCYSQKKFHRCFAYWCCFIEHRTEANKQKQCMNEEKKRKKRNRKQNASIVPTTLLFQISEPKVFHFFLLFKQLFFVWHMQYFPHFQKTVQFLLEDSKNIAQNPIKL